jgi:signal transduction histidine kinase/tRNA A-37 threonylcarbamoyl transferase component Bud32
MSRGAVGHVSLGSVLASRYYLSELIGEGGMARVYRATDRALDRTVAVKILHPDLARDERLRTRFQREAAHSAALTHPAVIRVYDTGAEDGLPFIVMELVSGWTIRDLLDEQTVLPPARAVKITIRVCSALAAAHERGIVHGDIKPSNIILTDSGQVKVIDFGSASSTAPQGVDVGDVVLATRAYCSPEQGRGQAVDVRSDIYSLGLVLHRMLTEESPAADLPPSLRSVVRRATAVDPADRYQSARELRADLVRAGLEPAADDPDDNQESALTKPLPPDNGGRAEEPPDPSPRRPSRSLPLPVRLAAVNALVVAAALLIALGLTLQITRSHMQGELRDRLATVAQSYEQGPAARSTQPAGLRSETWRWLAAQALPDDAAVAVRTDQGEVLTSGGLTFQDVPRSFELLSARESRWWNLTGGDTNYLALTVPLERDGRSAGTLVVVAGQARANATWRTLLSTAGLASVVGLAIAALLAFVTVRRTLRPLSRMSNQVDSIQTEDDLSRRVGGDGPRDEVGRLAAAFNRMLTRLEDTVRSQRRFVSDASHELRTPLTVAKGQLDLAVGENDPAESRHALDLVDVELDRMGRIVGELLLLAKLDEGLPLAREPVEVELILQEALLRGLQTERREATVEVDPGLHALADRDRLLQVLSNLVTNAVQHAGENARLVLRAGQRDGQVVIEVSDDGQGIPPEDMPHVFDRFYRSQARPGGTGLGLAIAASITRAMAGQITVRSHPGRGTTFTVLLPVAKTI